MVDIVALHGFTMRGASFEELECFLEVPVFAPDLPGHGREPVRSWDATVGWATGLLSDRPEPPILLGYSMGGRIALAVAVRRPDLMSGLVMISAAPGIADDDERSKRRAADRRLAARIGNAGVDDFLDAWYGRKMFSGLAGRGSEWFQADRDRRLTNTGAGLAGALRELGQGVQPDLRPDLEDLALPVLLITGEQDSRYCEIAAEMADRIPDVSTVVVRHAGHSLVGERPEAIAEAVLAWAAQEAVGSSEQDAGDVLAPEHTFD